MIDIGANLTDKAFADDLGDVLARARDAGVEHILVTGTTLESSKRGIALAQKHPGVLKATVGVHPHDAEGVSPGWIDVLCELAVQPGVAAIGEMGLDFNRNYSPEDAQRRVFGAQLDAARSLGMPIFVHDRDTNGGVREMLASGWDDPSRCVVHCFTGTAAELDAYVAAGYYIGITGWICDERRGRALWQMVGRIPRDRLLLETDSPYLLPRNMNPRPRSRRNEPAFLRFVVEEAARALREDPDELGAATADNARRLFGLD